MRGRCPVSRFLPSILFLAACAALSAGGAGEAQEEGIEPRPRPAAQQIVLRLAETHVPDYPTTRGDVEFARLVEERTDGHIRIEVYHSSQLGQEKAVIEQVQFGAIDFTRVSISPVAMFAGKLDALQMPYLYRDADHMWKVLDGPIGDEILASLEPAGFAGLAWYDAGSRHFYNSRREIRSVADLRGLKIRSQESDLALEMVSVLGAVPAPMPFGDVYSALQTGLIDGAENNWPSYLSTGHYTVARYLTLDGHTRVPEILIASKITMDRLPPREQALIRQAARDSMPYQIRLWAEFEKVAEQKVRAAGNLIIAPTAQQLAGFQAAVRPLYERMPADLKELVRRIQAVQ